MKIHLPLNPEHFAKPSTASSTGPLVSIGGDLVLLELQGELHWEGDNSDGVVGLLGLDRPDKPTLHLGEHHLLHGKIANLAKPFAVIRKAVAPSDAELKGQEVQGDELEEEDSELDEAELEAQAGPSRSPLARLNSRKRAQPADNEDEDELPLFPRSKPGDSPTTPGAPLTSSPFMPPSTARDWSSDLDPSSPYRSDMDDYGFPVRADDEGEEEREFDRLRRDREKKRRERRAAEREKRRAGKERTRYYEVVGVVRKKVVFALRPEPIVTATVLPT